MTPVEMAGEALRDEVEFLGEHRVGTCHVTMWRRVNNLPFRRVAIAQQGSDIFVVSDRLMSLQKLLEVARPTLENVAEMASLLNDTLNMRYALLGEANGILERDTGNRPSPEFRDGEFIFYVNDFFKGRACRILIRSTYEISIEDVGEGVKSWS